MKLASKNRNVENHLFTFSQKHFLMISKLPSVSPKMDEEKKFLALVDDAYLPNI